MDQKTGKTETAQNILDLAQELVQRRGYNAFSYADIAGSLNMTKASLHYHFPSKSDLGLALVSRYDLRFRACLAQLEASQPDAPAKFRAYVEIYAGVLAQKRMCLCGILAAEFESLPAQVQTALAAFFDHNEGWLARLLEQGRRDKSLAFEGEAAETARFIVASLEGAMLLARSHDDDQRFRQAARRLTAMVGIA